jgi:ketosteroid isomerase-like protein
MDTTPREVFQRMQERWLGHPKQLKGDEYADAVVIEIPFAPAGHRRRFEGKQEFLDFANPQRAALPVRFDRCRTVAIHDTQDPDTIVVEYELTGTMLPTNKQSTAGFIGVLTVKDGKIARWREYQDTLAMMQALQ